MPPRKTTKKKSEPKKRRKDEDSASDEDTTKKSRLKFEDAPLDDEESKPTTVAASPAPEEGKPTPPVEIKVTPPPAPVEEEKREEAVVNTFVPSDRFVPLAALEAVPVDRASEASHGLLLEPNPPAANIVRVTREGEPAPSLPTQLLQLLTT